MRFGSVCSGIEAASVAWHPLGWETAWVSEIEPFPCAVLAHRLPGVPNHGDMTLLPTLNEFGAVEAPDVLVGGTPCQAFSVAGMRRSLDDARGNLSLTFMEIANAIDDARAERGEQPAIIVWENVPGVLSTKDNAFGCFLAGLAGETVPLVAPGGRWANAGVVVGPQRTVAWRVLDAQYFGLAQRRRRVFVVASARDGFDPAAVLFEWDGVRRDSAPSREAREGTAGRTEEGSGVRGAGVVPETVGTLCADTHPGSYTGRDAYTGRLIPHTAHTLRAEGFDASEDGTGRGTPLVPVSVPVSVALRGRDGGAAAEVGDDVAFTLRASSGGGDKPHAMVPVAFHHNAQACQLPTDTTDTTVTAALTCSQGAAVASAMQVRRLTPRECERLQGFPDDYTLIPTTMVTHRKTCALYGIKEVVPEGTDRAACGCKAKHVPVEQCPDGPRYKALGNSMAVPVMRWIGARINTAVTAAEFG